MYLNKFTAALNKALEIEGDDLGGGVDADEEDKGTGGVFDNLDDKGARSQDADIDEEPEAAKAPERPEYIGEAFWDKEKGEPRLEAMAKSLADTKAALTKAKQNDDKPLASADEYVESLEFTFGEEEAAQLGPLDKATDPMIASFAAVAKEEGIGADRFARIVNSVLTDMAPVVAENTPPSIDYDAEMDKLGGKDATKALVNTIDAWASSSAMGLNEEQQERIKAWGHDAVGLNLLRQLRAATGEAPIPVNQMRADMGMSREELSERVNDPRNGTDAAFAAETQKLRDQFAGTGNTLGGRVNIG